MEAAQRVAFTCRPAESQFGRAGKTCNHFHLLKSARQGGQVQPRIRPAVCQYGRNGLGRCYLKYTTNYARAKIRTPTGATEPVVQPGSQSSTMLLLVASSRCEEDPDAQAGYLPDWAGVYVVPWCSTGGMYANKPEAKEAIVR